jgi:G patch domain-containing protein 1
MEFTSDEEAKKRKNIRFAPKDVELVLMQPKLDTKGLDYFGIDPNAAVGGSGDLSLSLQLPIDRSLKASDDHKSSTGHIDLFGMSETRKSLIPNSKGKGGIKGHAFGIGAFEEEDNDIYAVESVQKYDFTLGGEEKDPMHGWTAPKSKKSRNPNADQVNSLLMQVSKIQILPGFTPASESVAANKQTYKNHPVPSGFKPFHVFTSTRKKPLTNLDGKSVQVTLPIEVRSALLGENLKTGTERVWSTNQPKPSRWGTKTPSASGASDETNNPTQSSSANAFVTEPTSESRTESATASGSAPASKPSFLPSFVPTTEDTSSQSTLMKSPIMSTSQLTSASFSPFSYDSSKNNRSVLSLSFCPLQL